MKLSRQPSNPAFTLIDLMIVLAVLAILVALIVPSRARARARASRINCVCNLKAIGLSFRTWALDHQEKYPMSVSVTNGGTMELVEKGLVSVHFEVMSNELSTPKILLCPEEKRRTRAVAFGPGLSDANVSYFVGVDASENQPQRLLSGDDNLAAGGLQIGPGLISLTTNTPIAWLRTRHVVGGNIALADGSVQQFSPARLAEAFVNTGTPTNRLAFP